MHYIHFHFSCTGSLKGCSSYLCIFLKIHTRSNSLKGFYSSISSTLSAYLFYLLVLYSNLREIQSFSSYLCIFHLLVLYNHLSFVLISNHFSWRAQLSAVHNQFHLSCSTPFRIIPVLYSMSLLFMHI